MYFGLNSEVQLLISEWPFMVESKSNMFYIEWC